MLTLSLAMILSMAVFSSSAALRQTGSTTFTINGVSYACTGYFYTSGMSIYGGWKRMLRAACGYLSSPVLMLLNRLVLPKILNSNILLFENLNVQ